MSNLLTVDSLNELLSVHQPPCLSIYQPTHRQHPENQQDPIRFRNLVKELEASLQQKYPLVEVRNLLKPFEALAQDHNFWKHTLDGLAVLGGAGLFRVFRLPRPVVELAVAADSFHTKPLRRFLQSVGRHQVLGLSLRKIQFFEGNRDTLDEIDLVPGVPRTITDALGDELTEPHTNVASYDGIDGDSTPMHHGHGGKADEVDSDAERFFRAVDRAVLEHYSRPSGLPLILAALPEHHHLFRKVSQNPFLINDGIPFNPESLPIDDLHLRAWKVVEPQYLAQLAVWSEDFMSSKANERGSDDLTQVAKAAAAGRVKMLLIESGRQIAGRLNSETGLIQIADLSHPQVDDVLDDLGELVVKTGGEVYVVPTAQMPSKNGLAATYRY